MNLVQLVYFCNINEFKNYHIRSSQILESTKPIVENSKHIQINLNKISEIAPIIRKSIENEMNTVEVETNKLENIKNPLKHFPT